MPLYLSQHTLACLTRQGAEVLMRRMQAAQVAKAERSMVNMLEGKMFAEFRAIPEKVWKPGSKPKGCTSIGWCASNGNREKANSFKLSDTEPLGRRIPGCAKKEMRHSPLCVTLFDSKSRKEPNNV